MADVRCVDGAAAHFAGMFLDAHSVVSYPAELKWVLETSTRRWLKPETEKPMPSRQRQHRRRQQR